MIYVTSYWQLETDFRHFTPDWLISILGPSDQLSWPELGSHDRRLRIAACNNADFHEKHSTSLLNAGQRQETAS